LLVVANDMKLREVEKNLFLKDDLVNLILHQYSKLEYLSENVVYSLSDLQKEVKNNYDKKNDR